MRDDLYVVLERYALTLYIHIICDNMYLYTYTYLCYIYIYTHTHIHTPMYAFVVGVVGVISS